MPEPDPLFEPVLVCRPALPMDTPAMLEITSHIWDREDYVPEVWAEWLLDSEGLLAVVEFGGRVVGVGKLTCLLPGSWWLEGLRIHPDFEGRGFGSRLFAYLHTYWLRHGDGLIRLATYSENHPIHRMCARMGYYKVAEFTPFQATALPVEAPLPFTQLAEAQVPWTLETASIGEVLALCRGLVDLDWVWIELNPEHLMEAAREGRLWSWRDGQGILAGRTNDSPGESNSLYAMLLGCPLNLLGEMLVDFRKLAGNLGNTGAGWNAPLDPKVLPILEQAGYTRFWEDGSLYIFEYRR